MSLYRKHRPTDFAGMVGNSAQIEAFQKNLEKPEKKAPHFYMIVGPSGCGKTTLARMAAKNYLGIDDLNIREVNTADNRGIDTARDIIQQMQFLPPTGGKVAYIIDEVHMTSRDWQNAMLKPLEDTPSHVYFFLCTTNPEKLAKAIHTRATKVKVETLEPKDLYKLVRKVAKKENLFISKEILEELAENAEGSPRQALVLLEAISEMDDEKKMREIIALGEVTEAASIELCRTLLSGGWKSVSKVLDGLRKEDPEKVRRAVLGYMTAVLLKSGKHRAAIVLENFNEPFYNTGFPGLVLASYLCFAEEA